MSTDEDDSEELWAPFKALQPFFAPGNMSKERIEAANESMIADLLGEEPRHPPASRLDLETTRLMYAIMELHGPINRFDVYKRMFQHYPWREKISKADHLRSTYYLFVHECYIFEERLKIFFDAIEGFAKKESISIDNKRISRAVMKLHKRIFSKALQWRGVHVHQDDFIPREIRRVGLLETMILGEKIGYSKMRSARMGGVWKILHREAIKDVKDQWVVNCEQAAAASREITKLAYKLTKPVWSRIAQQVPTTDRAGEKIK